MVEEDGIGEDEHAHHAAAEEGTPPPAVVLRSELEVDEANDNAGANHREEGEDDEEDPEERVHLVAPHGREQEMELDADCAEGEEPCQEELHEEGVPDGRGGDSAGAGL